FPILGAARNTINGRHKMRVPVSSTSTFGNENAFAGFRKVMDHSTGFIIVDYGSHGHRNLEVFAIAAVPVAPLSVSAPLSPKHVVKPKFQKRVFVSIGSEVNAAAIA